MEYLKEIKLFDDDNTREDTTLNMNGFFTEVTVIADKPCEVELFYDLWKKEVSIGKATFEKAGCKKIPIRVFERGMNIQGLVLDDEPLKFKVVGEPNTLVKVVLEPFVFLDR